MAKNWSTLLITTNKNYGFQATQQSFGSDDFILRLRSPHEPDKENVTEKKKGFNIKVT